MIIDELIESLQKIKNKKQEVYVEGFEHVDAIPVTTIVNVKKVGVYDKASDDYVNKKVTILKLDWTVFE